MKGDLYGEAPIERNKQQQISDTHRPTSKLGDAMGDSSVVIVKMPSNFRSGLGAAMEAEMRARALIGQFGELLSFMNRERSLRTWSCPV